MRIKINEGYVFQENSHVPSDLYRKFSQCFDFLLAPEINEVEYIRSCYVSSILDEELQSISNNHVDGIYKLMGYTGIGKTTLICKNFGIIPGNNVPKAFDKTVIIPAFFDADIIYSESEIHSRIERKIKAVCTYIKTEYQITQTKEEYEQLMYNMIVASKSCLLEYLNDEDRYEPVNNSLALRAFREKNSEAYFLCELKMYATIAGIENLIFILDDLETQPIEYIEEIILKYLHNYTCLKNYNARTYCVKLLISSRPHTLRFLNSLEQYQRILQAYGLSKELSISSPPPICDIFKKRMEYAISKITSDGSLQVTNQNSWQNALSVLITITNRIDLDFGKLLYELNHYNIRETLNCFICLLCNRQWLQRNQNIEPSFIISVDDFSISKSAVLKAIIYGNNTVYKGNRLVPNILYSDYDYSFELYGLLVIKHFLWKHAVVEYGLNYIDIYDFLEYCEKLWENEEILKTIIICINNLIDNKILLYSVCEKEYADKHIGREDHRKLYLSSKGMALWNLLGNDSILFEAYREDTFRDNNDIFCRKKNYEAFQEDILIDCLTFLKTIANSEVQLLRTVINQGKTSLYNKLFGGQLVSENILNGINNTIIYYYVAHNRDQSSSLTTELNVVKAICNSVNITE